MRFYKVVLSKDAVADIDSIYGYISTVLKENLIAQEWLIRIRNAIQELDFLPNKHELVEREPWRSEGIRQKPFEKFVIFYHVSESGSIVTITGVKSTSKKRE